jgi:serine/threonine protein kinase
MEHVISAVEHLHARNIVHRDIKPDNILLDDKDTAKLCDFGMADYHGSKVFSGRGTMPYMAPEIIQCQGTLVADKAHDVWALGVTLFVLLTGAFPWGSAEPGDAEYEAFCRREYHRLAAWHCFHPALSRFLQEHVFVGADRRCSVSGMRVFLSLPWLRPAEQKEPCSRSSSYHGMTRATRSYVPARCLSSTPSSVDGLSLVLGRPGGTKFVHAPPHNLNLR